MIGADSRRSLNRGADERRSSAAVRRRRSRPAATHACGLAAKGIGVRAAGGTIAHRDLRDAPTFVAIGVFSIVFATGSLVTLWLARR
jgi:hypothetical protein